jgi:hypothetical protein
VLNTLPKATIEHSVGRLWPLIEGERKRAQSVLLLEALEEITQQVSCIVSHAVGSMCPCCTV